MAGQEREGAAELRLEEFKELLRQVGESKELQAGPQWFQSKQCTWQEGL